MAEDEGANAVQLYVRHMLSGFQERLTSLTGDELDFGLICKLGDEIQAAADAAKEAEYYFNANKFNELSIGLSILLNDTRALLDRFVRSENGGIPNLVKKVLTGRRGQPRLVISDVYLRETRFLNSAPQIGRRLGVSRNTVRRNFVGHEIEFPERPLDVTDEDLTTRVREILELNSDLGVTMVAADLKWKFGIGARRERVLAAIKVIQPNRADDNRAVVRCEYSVPGPQFLWHHNGHHVIIMFGIVTHAFIDGHSRFIVAICASPNNKAQTVLSLFLEGARTHGVPSHIRGDHGVENLLVASWMEKFRGPGRGSYIWGRSVHNTRIERLWRDLKNQVIGYWKGMFETLEREHGLDKDNTNHKWLLHLLFLDALNADIADFAERWNSHVLRRQDAENQSPRALFFNDMLVRGFRGDPLPPDGMPRQNWWTVDPHPQDSDEIEWLGTEGNVEAEQDGQQLRPWMGPSRRPVNGPAVVVDDPTAPFDNTQCQALLNLVAADYGKKAEGAVVNAWRIGLAFARTHFPDIF